MATIKHISSGAIYHLPSVAHVGRDTTCELHLDNALVSGMHARMSWSGTTWEVRDLGSINGTFVDKKAIPGSVQVPLRRGSILAFGDPDEAFTMIDDSAPTISAQTGGVWVYGQENTLELPTRNEPAAVIYCDGGWFIERFDNGGQEAVQVQDREQIDIAGQHWRIYLPIIPSRTRRPDAVTRRIRDTSLRLHASRDFEHIDIRYLYQDREYNVRPRVHGQLLYCLAKARLDDVALGNLPMSEHGWRYRTQVVEDLGIVPRLLSVHIWRAKDQVRSEVAISDFGELIENRPDSGQIRLGIANIEIQP